MGRGLVVKRHAPMVHLPPSPKSLNVFFHFFTFFEPRFVVEREFDFVGRFHLGNFISWDKGISGILFWVVSRDWIVRMPW